MSVWSAMVQEIRDAAHNAVSIVDADALVFEIPPDPAMGDIAVPCFALAKALHEAPQKIAQRLCDAVTAHPLVARAEVKGAYCNVTLKSEEVARRVFGATTPSRSLSPHFGGLRSKMEGEKRKKAPIRMEVEKPEGEVVLEFISPNTNKPLHLGHLRNAFYGEAVGRLLEAAGHRVHRVMLLNDRGIAMAKAMLAYARWGQGTTPESEGIKGDHFVGNWYVVFEQKAKAERATQPTPPGPPSRREGGDQTELEVAAQELVRKWEAGDAETRALWERMCDWVIAGHAETYVKLGIAFVRTYRESDIYERGRAIVERGRAHGVFVRDAKGNTVAKLDAAGLDDKVVERADGTTVYATQDFALVAAKAEEYPHAAQVVVTAVEQDYYFQQLNAMLGMLAMPKVEHLSYEMVNLPEGKMKSREGTVVDADDLIAKLEEFAAAEIAQREDAIPGEPDAGTDEPPVVVSDDARARATHIALAALRFMLLNVSPHATVTFDPRAAVAFTGKTGPYLQYAHARTCAILRRANGDAASSVHAERLTHGSEKQLLLSLARFPDALAQAAAERDPSALTQVLYTFAQRFADFYRDVPVLGAEDVELRAARLALVSAVRDTFARGLTILGIAPIERM